MLATLLKRWNDAERHFEEARAMHERLGALPWLAYTQLNCAQMLCSRKAKKDGERARQLLETCRATAASLGMKALEEKADAALVALVRKPDPGRP